MSLLPIQTAQLSSGAQLAYTDSWSSLPASERPNEFTTIFALHGVGFNSAVWTPILPLLPPSIRFIAYNQRSYKGSSQAVEIKEPGGVDAAAQYFVDMLDMFEFCVEELGAKKVEEGGVVLLGWSKGTVSLISLLSLLHASAPPAASGTFASSLPSLLPSPEDGLIPHASLLTTHLRSIILYEPPSIAVGAPPTPDVLTHMFPLLPPATPTQEEWVAGFTAWVGLYSNAPAGSSEPPTSSLPASGLAAFSPELLEATYEPTAIQHNASWGPVADYTALGAWAKAALAPPLSPAVPLGLVYGERTMEGCLVGAKTIEDWWGVKAGEGVVKAGEEDGGRKRKTAVRSIPLTNHFAHVHEPEKFVKALMELVEELGQ
ncbi:hypothetical protein JCM8547_002462 [Rhodosporidiobolus lusitaniae]